jgi:hypothetical protein
MVSRTWSGRLGPVLILSRGVAVEGSGVQVRHEVEPGFLGGVPGPSPAQDRSPDPVSLADDTKD